MIRSNTDVGSIRTATVTAGKSLKALFDFVAELLDQDATTRPTPGHPKVDVLAMNMLNCHLAPFLARWHPIHDQWRAQNPGEPESAWPDNATFRAELRQLQSTLRQTAMQFATMADYHDYSEFIGLTTE